MGRRKQPQRLEAIATGKSTYWTGKPCKHGHTATRNTVDSSCVECRRIFREGYRLEAVAYAQRRRDEMVADDPEGTRARWAEDNRQRRLRYPEAVRAMERKNSRLKRQRHPQTKNAETRARQCAMIQRTPPWADLKAIRRIYEACPPGLEVDHVIPLRGKTVSGLHVAGNLQYLAPDANKAKGNRFEDLAA